MNEDLRGSFALSGRQAPWQTLDVFRSEVSSQLRKDSMSDDQDPVYLRRLETARQILDQKVTSLSADGSVRAKVAAQDKPQHKRTSSKFANASLQEVLYDTSGLSCFMEFMDQADLMRLVQFWLVVDSFRNPLEVDTDEPPEHVGSFPAWSDSDRADLAQIYDAYLSKPELKILPEAGRAVAEFLRTGRAATSQQYYNARHALLEAQTTAYNQLQEPYFRRFKKSNLYYKWLAMDQATNVEKNSITTKRVGKTLGNPTTVPPAISRTTIKAKGRLAKSP